MRGICSTVGLLMVIGLSAQSGVHELGKASDVGQRTFDRQVKRQVAGPDTSVMEQGEVEVPPAYPGGDPALLRDLARAEGCNTLPVGEDCPANTKVRITLIVERDGRVSAPNVEQGVCPALEQRARCAVQGLARFEPGRHQGRTVRTRMHIPIQYEPR